jgi:Putative Ig domain
MRIAILRAIVLVLGIGPPPGVSGRLAAAPTIEDIFGRSLDVRGLTLVDWEGYIANPAIRFTIVSPNDAAYPARVIVRAREPRLYFDLPSRAGPQGPTKEIRLERPGRASVCISIFPDRDGRDEDYTLEVEISDARGRQRRLSHVPVHVVDQDQHRPAAFPITVNFTQDRTGFFRNKGKREVVTRAAEDWAYFFDGGGLVPVPAQAETTLIWNSDGFKTNRPVKNDSTYTGYLLYAYGIDSPLLRSGGEPSSVGGFQSQAKTALPIRRSGGCEVETKGNYNTKGWRVDLGDADWWRATNLREVANDLDSIVHHELGHAFIFNPANTRFATAKRLGKITDGPVKAYLGVEPAIDRDDHLAGSIDPASLRGAFGHEYHGKMPHGRWLITKLDLLCAQAVGYRLRETTAFLPVDLLTDKLSDGVVLAPYMAKLRAVGGIPFYDWTVVDGVLPDGLVLDRFTGELRGTPKRSGAYNFTVLVREYDATATGRTRRLRLTINSA